MRTINSKTEYFRLWENGLIGNTLKVWGSIADIKEEGYKGQLSARVKRATGGGFYRYNIKNVAEAEQTVAEWVATGIPENQIYFNESAPDQFLIMQGEIMRSTDYYDLTYSREQIKMRDAMRSAKTMKGVSVVSYLETIMTPSSYEDIKDLFEIFPDSVIEFGVYQHCLGKLPSRNCLIWEVRNY